MGRLTKLGIVLAGYALALAIAIYAVRVRQLQTQGNFAQASSGMYAFGDFALVFVVFVAVALFPTSLALYFLRPYEKFWRVISVVSLTVAATSPVALLLNHLGHSSTFLAVFTSLFIFRMLGAPLLSAFFLTVAVFSPARHFRWKLLGAVAIETTVGIYTFFN